MINTSNTAKQAIGLSVLAATTLVTASVRARTSEMSDADWMTYNRNLQGDRYSPLKEIPPPPTSKPLNPSRPSTPERPSLLRPDPSSWTEPCTSRRIRRPMP